METLQDKIKSLSDKSRINKLETINRLSEFLNEETKELNVNLSLEEKLDKLTVINNGVEILDKLTKLN